jgi:hypothetical protein
MHCLDYLRFVPTCTNANWTCADNPHRQALMCAADSNLEDTHFEGQADEEIASAPGWGSKRLCGDYGTLKEWSRKRRATDGMDIGT